MKIISVLATMATALSFTTAITGAPCRQLNAEGMALIEGFEGFAARPAPDPIGKPTVGYGHLCQRNGCSEVPYGSPLTPATATSLLRRDLEAFTSCLVSSLNGPFTLNQNQWAALTSWAFSIGCPAVRTSSLIKRLNAGENPITVVSSELPQWNKAGGRVVPGLVRRRQAELALFNRPSSEEAYPNCA